MTRHEEIFGNQTIRARLRNEGPKVIGISRAGCWLGAFPSFFDDDTIQKKQSNRNEDKQQTPWTTLIWDYSTTRPTWSRSCDKRCWGSLQSSCIVSRSKKDPVKTICKLLLSSWHTSSDGSNVSALTIGTCESLCNNVLCALNVGEMCSSLYSHFKKKVVKAAACLLCAK